MDVTCPRCQTDYEFDDALVSERGTTVKCTNCGHQFRVFRPRSSNAPPAGAEVWRIERREGEPLELRSLVELQRAIRAGRVTRTDLLQRGEGPPRRVGDIPELEPFFPGATPSIPQHTMPLPSSGGPVVPQMPPANRVPAHTPAYGKAPQPAAPPPAPARSGGTGTLRPGAAGPPPLAPPPARGEGSQPGVDRPRSAPPPPRVDTTIRTPLGLSPYHPASDPPAARLQTPLPPLRTPPPLRRDREGSNRASLHDLASGLPGTHGLAAATAATQPIQPIQAQTSVDDQEDPPTHRRVEAAASLDAPAPDTAQQPSREELYESLFPQTQRPRRSGAGWIVALLVVGAAAAVGFTVGKPYLQRFLGGSDSPSASASASSRLQEALAAGDRARVEGDYVVARESYLRATVIDDKSIGAWDGFCAAESELAIAHWIAALATGSALERDQASGIGGSAGRTCARWAELARGSDDGTRKAESDLRPARALAAQGNVSALRIYLPAHPGDPIVEALVYLASAGAAGGPVDGGRAADVKAAASALAKTPPSALATAGDLAVAAYVAIANGDDKRVQPLLDELARRAPRHMLLETLRSLATTGDAGPPPSTSATTVTSAGPAASASAGKLAAVYGDPSAKPVGGPVGGPIGVPNGETSGIPAGDYRDLDKKGHAALAGGDVSKAETMFRGALGQNPGDVDAMYGLGQIERSRGNHAGAISFFQQVLDHSPGFSPARLALADEQWGTGNQGAAIGNYKQYLENVPTGSGADRARSRVGQTEGTTTAAPTATTAD